MPVLHLGVLDLPYVNKRTKGQKRSVSTITTGDVAEILEAEYSIMETFADHGDLGSIIEKSLAVTVENLMIGGPLDQDPFGEATSDIHDSFQKFIDNREMEKLGVAGVPTQAALQGKSKRFKSGYTKGRKRRPSFQDTGLYETSFRAWVD